MCARLCACVHSHVEVFSCSGLEFHYAHSKKMDALPSLLYQKIHLCRPDLLRTVLCNVMTTCSLFGRDN